MIIMMLINMPAAAMHMWTMHVHGTCMDLHIRQT